jgi:hypothetical protein
MKQKITTKQVQELTAEQQQRLRAWWTPQEGDYIADGNHEEMIYYLNGIRKSKVLPLLSLGQMIEWLHTADVLQIEKASPTSWAVKMNEAESRDPELCDALWEMLKQVM